MIAAPQPLGPRAPRTSRVSRAARALLGALLLVLLAGVPAPRAAAADEAAALDTARTLVEGAHGAMTAEDMEQSARNDALRGVIADAFAFDIWERFLLRGRDEALTEAERTEFEALLPGYLADLYADRFGQGLEAKPEIEGAEPARNDVLVSAKIPRPNDRNLPVQWRVRNFEDRGHKVIDVMVGGISFLVLKREEFGAILDRDGAEGLLAHMRANSL